MLPIKKIYIDSRNRTPDSIDTSNFKIELPYSITLLDNTVFFVTDVCIPHSFTLIEKYVNDRIYYNYIARNPVQTNNFCNYITLPSGNYTSEMQSLMNSSVSQGESIQFVVSYDSGNNSINVSCSGNQTSFKFLTEDEITSSLYVNRWLNFTPANTKSANDILKINTPMKYYEAGETFKSDFISTQPINNVYLTSPNLGSFDTISPFSNNVIKKIPVNAPYGYVIIDQNSSPNDYLNCSRQTLRTIEFHLKDSRGRYINLHGMNISFSIVFNKFNINE